MPRCLTKISIALLTLSAAYSFALNEQFELYSSPGALAMGNAFTADAMGYAANYYNPAGLAKASRKQWEFHLIPFEVISSAWGTLASAKTMAIRQTTDVIKNTPGSYYYNRFNFVPAVSRRNISIAVLTSWELAAQSDGTNVDVFGHEDIVPTVGVGFNFAGNMLKLGVSAKAILRNELKGSFAHSALTDDGAVSALMHEGLGIGFNAGMLLTLPMKWLPTVGVSILDFGSTQFSPFQYLNPLSSGVPEAIPQSVHVAASLHPYFGRRLKGTLSAELKHLEHSSTNLLKKLHFGFQLEDERTFYLWAGLNQLYWSAGFAYRLSGGHLEIGSYGEEIGTSDAFKEDRRVTVRYTLSF